MSPHLRNLDKNPMTGFAIAIDGPAGAGKGTLARELARRYRMKYLDTGKLYRIVALRVLEAGGDPSHEADTLKACHFDGFDFRHVGNNQFAAFMNDREITADLSAPKVGAASSQVAFFSNVRKALKDFQVAFAKDWQEKIGVILDGRDIGTVICPWADYKFFLDARPEVRAKRRVEELQAKGYEMTYQEALAQILERDARDRGRTDAPLRAADDAMVIDTSNLNADQVTRIIVDVIGPEKQFKGMDDPTQSG